MQLKITTKNNPIKMTFQNNAVKITSHKNAVQLKWQLRNKNENIESAMKIKNKIMQL